MSRVGNSQIVVPQDVQLKIEDGGKFNFKLITVIGPKGTLTESIRRGVNFTYENNILKLTRDNELKQTKSYHGLYRSLINNMVLGVTNGFSKNLDIVGIGYRAEVQGQNVIFSLGYSHKITLEMPEGIEIKVEEQTKLQIIGTNKQKVGEISAKIRAFRKPEPYKGKGIKYSNEIIKKKSAKSV